MTIQKRQFALALMLLAVPMFAMKQPFTVADEQQTTGAITIHATGQAVPINTGHEHGHGHGQVSPSTATLSLTGSVHTEGNHELKIRDLTGTLEIGSSYFAYAITGGHGEINKKGKVEINARASDGGREFELVLHGYMQGGNIVFSSHESKLSSLYFLSLSGQVTLDLSTSTTSKSTTTTEADSETEDSQEED